MPNAILTEIEVESGYTYNTLVNNLKSALDNAGFGSTLYDDQFGSSNGYGVYEVVFDPDTSKPRSKGYFYVKIHQDSSTLDYKIYCRLGLDWDNVNHTGQFFSIIYDTNVLISNVGSTINFLSINHPEIKQVIIQQGTNIGRMCICMPANKINGWGLDGVLYLPGFIAAHDFSYIGHIDGYTQELDGDYSLGLSQEYIYTDDSLTPNQINPYSPSSSIKGNGYAQFYIDAQGNRVQNKNPKTQKYQGITAPFIFSYFNDGAVASFSQDLAIVATEGALQEYTTLSDGAKTYMMLHKNFPGYNSALAIKVG